MEKPEWIVLDIDGVLIDVSESYDRAVKLTAKYFLDQLGVDGSPSFETIRNFRKIGQFGDDYKVTEGLVLAHLSGNPKEILEEFPDGEDLTWIRNRVGNELDREEVKQIFDRLYFRGELPPIYEGDSGLWRKEKPLVRTPLLEKIKTRYNLGFITGRSREEIKLASKILNYEFKNIVTRDEYQKPDPRALETLVGEQSGIYLGDTFNDKLLVENFRAKGKDFSFTMIGEDKTVNEVLKDFINRADC